MNLSDRAMIVSLSDEVLDLCMRMGVALSVWQGVEDQHFHLFCTLIGDEVCKPVSAMTYYSTESFDARRVMVSRMVQRFPTTKTLRAEWNDLDKALKDSGENRNKIAHYGIYYSVYEAHEPDEHGHKPIKVGPPSLQPSAYNEVSELLGRTSDKPEHNVSATLLNDYIASFGLLAERVSRFNVECGQIQWPHGEAHTPPPPTTRVSPPPPLSTRRPEPDPSGG